jgi:two-component system, chemotaxis family, sensor kinase CheA
MARDRFRYFRIEARELLEHLGQGVLDLEKGLPVSDVVARLLRLAHTLKGAARVVKQQEIADLAHRFEDALAVLRELAGPVSRERINAVLALLDDITGRVAALTPSPAPGNEVVTVGSEELFRAFRPDVHEMDGLLEALAEAHGELASLRPLVSRIERARHLADLVADHLASPGVVEKGRSTDGGANPRARSLVEELRTTVGSLERDFGDGVDLIDRELREARKAAERLRLVPARALFTLLERTARDAAQALGKQVRFEGRGGDVRVDVQVLGIVQGALLQAVRNAVAHGIEPAADRMTAGKAPEGRVVLDVLLRGTFVVFACTDDGGGVDLEAVRRLAQRKGLPAAHTETMRPDDLLRLLLKGGISTSGTVTDVSGRGVGLDVVREAADRLGGEVSVRTDAGQGTTLEIIVPLTLASLPALLVEAGGIGAILPLDAVRGSFRVSPETVIRTAQGHSLFYEGQSIPFVMLWRSLSPDASSGRAMPSAVVVVQGQGAAAGFGVDRVVRIAHAMLRPLPDLASAASFVAGVSLDEEGVPRLVLDPDALVVMAHGALASSDEPASTRPVVLVVDDSLTTRMLEQSILESAGYAVDLAVSGEEALEKARTNQYALFLVDVEMPGMDGFTFIERTKAEPVLRSTPSILVTSRNSPDDQRRGREVGAQAYVVKSEFEQGVLLEHIRGLLS